MNSRLYVGTVEHSRYRPVPHAFRYRLFMPYLDLDELDRVFAGRWFWSVNRRNLASFRREDYLGRADRPLAEAVRERVAGELGFRPGGRICLLTHLRYFGHCFNPVSFYYCWDGTGETLEAVVAEITNTPWGERHAYVLDCRGRDAGAPMRFEFDKRFHVSPFMPMRQDYAWTITRPGDSLHVGMQNSEDGERIFSAHLGLTARPITATSLAGALAQFPAMTVRVLAAIHWQALRLWLKRVPFHVHPKHLDTTQESA